MTYEEGLGGCKLAKQYMGAVRSGQQEQVWVIHKEQHQWLEWNELRGEAVTGDKTSRTSSVMSELTTEEFVSNNKIWTTRKAPGANNNSGYLHLTVSEALYIVLALSF